MPKFSTSTVSHRWTLAAWLVAVVIVLGLVIGGVWDTASAPTTHLTASEPTVPREAPRAALAVGSAASGRAAEPLSAKALSPPPLALPAGTPLWLQQLAQQPVCTALERQRKAPGGGTMVSGGPAWARESRERVQVRIRQVAERLAASPDAELHVLGLMLLRQHEALSQEALQQHSAAAGYGLLRLCEAWGQGLGEKPTPAPEVCARLTPEQAWLMNTVDRFGLALQGLAAANGEAAEDLWLERATQHSPQITPLDRLSAAMLAHAPADWTPEDRAELALLGVAIWSSQVMPSLQGLTRACRPDRAAPGSLRQQRCLAVAEALDRPPNSQMAAMIAHRLGEWHGWSLERLTKRHVELHAGTAASIGLIPTPAPHQDVPDACTWLPRLRDHTVLLASQGEVGALADGVLRSGKTLDQWAQELPPFQARPWQAPASSPSQ
jgi:hypothetical protein